MKTFLAIIACGLLPSLAWAQDTPVQQKPFAAPEVPAIAARQIPKRNYDILPQAVAIESTAHAAVRTRLPASWKPPAAGAVSPIPRFRRDLLFRWNAPNGEMMKTMLRQIEEAEKAGDSATYARLTETYRTWAEKYLVRGAQPDNTQQP
jgi:hypothetical protein